MVRLPAPLSVILGAAAAAEDEGLEAARARLRGAILQQVLPDRAQRGAMFFAARRG